MQLWLLSLCWQTALHPPLPTQGYKKEQPKKKGKSTLVDSINKRTSDRSIKPAHMSLQGCENEFHLSVHGWKVPNAADDGPAAHHPQQIIHQTELTAVPEGIPKPRIILKDRNMAEHRYEVNEY